MATKKTGLGRGLNALISQGTPTSTGTARKQAQANPPPKSAKAGSKPAEDGSQASESPREVPVHLIVANPWQPREYFDEEGLEELAASIREMGVLSPLLVRQRKEDGSGYQLIAGERRFRAAQRAGLKTVPILLRDLTDQEALEIALVENLQRRDLNIIEEAEGYQRLAEDFGLTQEAIAKRVGKGRATVANAMRLLSLDPKVRAMVSENRLSAGHAKVLLALEIPEEQTLLAAQCERERWSVRELERQVKTRLAAPKQPKPGAKAKLDIPADHLQYLTDRLHQRLGTSVRISPTRTLPNGKKQRGKVEIDFYSNDDLDRVLDLLGLTGDL
ncbi:MAG: ParB/RepB/Spo0J family partition protein [Verrucomicrobia bacterium]|nr:ParB/RepB/Spo0J family partition protein [Verrucomicrobiota bacterium]MCH8527357.1 ParB/RepB/Spo0J family partition protein [Kiritimatiellia bacterium]